MKEFNANDFDGKLYSRTDHRTKIGYALRWKSGAFYFNDNFVKLAEKAGFTKGYNVKTYTAMPWGMQHTGHDFLEYKKEQEEKENA